MHSLIRAYDWSKSPLGPIEGWPQSLQTAVQILLSSRYAMWMGWGPELTFLYNDTYGRVTLAQKHPWALGRPAREVWSEIWTDLEPRIRTVFETGEATWDEGLLLFLERSGFPEETYHTFSYSPLTDDSGKIAGMLCVVTEETERVLGERQLASLRDLAEALTSTSTETLVFDAICSSLKRNDRDLPFTATYIFDESKAVARLGCTTGLRVDHPAAPPSIDVEGEQAVWPLRKMLLNRSPFLVDSKALPISLPDGGWKEAPLQAVLVPIASRGEQSPAGVLIAGLNRYRKWDEKYRGYMELVAGQIAGSLGNAHAYAQERKRVEALAELDRAKTTFF